MARVGHLKKSAHPNTHLQNRSLIERNGLCVRQRKGFRVRRSLVERNGLRVRLQLSLRSACSASSACAWSDCRILSSVSLTTSGKHSGYSSLFLEASSSRYSVAGNACCRCDSNPFFFIEFFLPKGQVSWPRESVHLDAEPRANLESHYTSRHPHTRRAC